MRRPPDLLDPDEAYHWNQYLISTGKTEQQAREEREEQMADPVDFERSLR